ncbi:MAG: glycosyltransferase [Candidatus Glassbacteria bacterium]|nr:glycosyltransferase [Candidatus Glassbacteria bacterium]
MPRVIYLVALENIFDNAIFENMVKKLLLRIQGDRERRVELTLVCLLPWFELTRRGPYSNFRRFRRQMVELRRELSSRGVGLEFVRTPVPSAFFDMGPVLLAWLACWAVPAVWWKIVRLRARVVHCRYYYAAFLALAARLLVPGPVRVIFDVRTLLPEQGLVNRKWREGGPAFRFWKALERWMLGRADKVVSVSPAMTARLEQESPGLSPETIPNFVDLEHFRADEELRRRVRRELGVEHRRVLVFSGTLGGRYPYGRMAECAELFFRMSGPEGYLMVLTGSDEKRLAPLVAELEHRGRRRGADWQAYHCKVEEVPGMLAAADWALLVLADFLTSETFLPIKFAEYLALGLPILTHPANRELARLVLGYRVGAVLDPDLPEGTLRSLLTDGPGAMRDRCRQAAREHFDLDRFASRYAALYRELAAGLETGPG